MKPQLYLAELRSTVVLLMIGSVLSGCSSTYEVPYTTDEKLNEGTTGEDATIEVRDGKEISAKEVKVVSDSASWLDADTHKKSNMGREKIEKVVVLKRDHLGGAFEGFGACTALGLGIGWLSTAGNTVGYNREFGGLNIFFGGIVGAVTGLVAGAIIGHRNYYEYQLREGSDSIRETRIEEPSIKTDVLYLKNGDIVRGTITSESLMYITIQGVDGRIYTYYATEIERVKKR